MCQDKSQKHWIVLNKVRANKHWATTNFSHNLFSNIKVRLSMAITVFVNGRVEGIYGTEIEGRQIRAMGVFFIINLPKLQSVYEI